MRPSQLIPPEPLAEVFATFAPMDAATARRRAEIAIETLVATRSRSDILQLGLALQTLELGPFRRFTRSTQQRRERALLAWATSPIPQQRTAFQALKRLALFLAYAEPGADPTAPQNDAWRAMGYEPPPRPAEPVETLVRPLDVPRVGSSPLTLDADVVVVGSGAGGGVVAARLAERGRDVIVIEAGGYRPEVAMPTSEAEAWREMFLDRGATSTDDLSFTILGGATLGGGTTVNWTTTIRPPKWLRDDWESSHGLAGLNSSDADADLDRLENELGLMAPTLVPPKDRLILDGAKSLGWEADRTMRNAGPCSDCGGCTFGCARGSKRSGVRAHLATAQASGARILTGARATRLRQQAGAVRGVDGRLVPGGRPFAIRAPQVVLAAGGLRTPVLLQRSGVDHPAIGRNLRLHPTVVLGGLLEEPVDMWIGPLQAARSLEFARPGSAGDMGPAHGGFIIEAAPAHPGLAMAALPWSSRADAVARAADLRHLAPLIGIIRDQGSGIVRAERSGRARITYHLDRRDAATARRALIEMSRLARAGGAVELVALATPGRWWRRPDDFDAYLAGVARTDTGTNRVTLFSAHQMGSARAGNDPHASAADPWGRVRSDRHGGLLSGAYIGDGSLLPTAPGVNPMLTIMALAERTARAVLADRA